MCIRDRDAPPVQTRAAQLALLDEGHPAAQLRRPEGAGIPARPTAEEDDVIVADGFSRHGVVLLRWLDDRVGHAGASRDGSRKKHLVIDRELSLIHISEPT